MPSCQWCRTCKRPVSCLPTAMSSPRSRATREAQELVGAEPRPREPQPESPEEDYSVLDADSSQRHAIDTVLAGRSLVIHGPPGTGKSQTIANLIAALVARGRKVLFVAEKRAAIDAVLSRLKGVDLGEIVLDIHEGTRDRQRIASELGDPRSGQQIASARRRPLHRGLSTGHQRRRRHVVRAAPAARAVGPDAVRGPVGAARHAGRGAHAVPAAGPGAPGQRSRRRRSATSSASSLTSAGSPCGRAARPGTAPAPHRRRRQAGAASWPARWTPRRCRCSPHTGGGAPAEIGLRRRAGPTPSRPALMRLYAGHRADRCATFDSAVYRAAPRLAGHGDRRRRRARPARAPRGCATRRALPWRATGAKPSWEELHAALERGRASSPSGRS